MNLLSNAVKFTSFNGLIKINARYITKTSDLSFRDPTLENFISSSSSDLNDDDEN